MVSQKTQDKRDRAIAKAIEEQKYKEGYRYKIQYFNGETKFFKEKPKPEDEKDAVMISNIIIW